MIFARLVSRFHWFLWSQSCSLRWPEVIIWMKMAIRLESVLKAPSWHSPTESAILGALVSSTIAILASGKQLGQRSAWLSTRWLWLSSSVGFSSCSQFPATFKVDWVIFDKFKCSQCCIFQSNALYCFILNVSDRTLQTERFMCNRALPVRNAAVFSVCCSERKPLQILILSGSFSVDFDRNFSFRDN